MSEIILYSDGGSQGGAVAGSACIVENTATETRVKFTAFLGEATNNEAEICASLIGYSFLNLLPSKPTEVRWVCDSEYVLKSATQYILNWQKNGWRTANKKPVKNQGLWRAYLYLSRGLKITANHVYGHTGHPENEACDVACNWVRGEGAELLESAEEGTKLELDDRIGTEDWLLLDGQDFLAHMRGGDGGSGGDPSEKEILALKEKLNQFGCNSF